MSKKLTVTKVLHVKTQEGPGVSKGAHWNLHNETEAKIQVSYQVNQNLSFSLTWLVLVAEVHGEGHRPYLQLFQVMQLNVSEPEWQWHTLQLSPARTNDLLNELRRMNVVPPPACVRNCRTHRVVVEEIEIIE